MDNTQKSDCIFCKIAAGEIVPNVVVESEHAVAFLDNGPIAPGHTLVVPRAHADKLSELPEAAVGPLFSLAQKAAGILEKGLKPDGLTIGINQGIGQGVPHLHVHLVPRWHTDGGGSIHTVVKNPPTESVEEILKKLAS
jgi:histidine triad (HIT) family protein